MPLALKTEQIWHQVERRSFAVLGYVTPAGQARTTGVDYAVHDRRLYVAVGRNSWKARHIARTPTVSMTVLVPRGGLLALLVPIPPAAITMHGTAAVLEPEAAPGGVLARALRGVDTGRPDAPRPRILEFSPEGDFLTYGVGVPLLRMRHPEESQGRAPVAAERADGIPAGAREQEAASVHGGS